MNKKADIMAIVYLVLILFILLFAGLFMAFGSLVINWVFDEAMPELTNLGQVGSTNASQIGQLTLNPVNNVVQSFTWLGGVIYIMAILGCIGISTAFRLTGDRWLMGFFVVCMLMIIIASLFISNIYQDFYDGNDDVGPRLKEQTILSFLILYSPMIMCIIGFVCGIIMFSGYKEEGALQ